MDKTDKLEACPWCLGPARLTSTSNGDAGDGYMWRIACAEDNDCAVAPEFYYESEELAVTRWNTRSRASVAAPPPDAMCLLCGHNEAINGYCTALVLICSDGYHGTHLCGCRCQFREPAARSDAAKPLITIRECEACPKCGLTINGLCECASPEAAPVDAETLNRLLDALPEIPSEEEAEAVLQAAGTSGKEVVNGFIERLLRENLELKTKLNTARHYFCSCGGALTAEEYIEHYFEKGHDQGKPAFQSTQT